MQRRHLLLISAAGVWGAETRATALRGTLREGEPPTVETAGGKRVPVDGDAEIRGVLRDKRVIGSDFEVMGNLDSQGTFQALAVHENPLFVYKGGKRLYVTYWCEVCAIRTRTPAVCWCCQEETELDLRDRKD